MSAAVDLSCSLDPIRSHRIGRYLHAVFGEFFGGVIYDGVWVGDDPRIPNRGGIRRDVIDGMIEAGVTAIRWPGGCCADHYHWRDGVGVERKPRIHPMPSAKVRLWRHEFGTDEFLRLCRLVGAEPILVANVATGAPAEFLDWFEYCNGDPATKYGSLRASGGHAEPYGVRIWGLGNTDENVWHVDHDNPMAYAQDFLRWRTTIRDLVGEVKLIGLGLSERHETPGWVEAFLDHVTAGGRQRGPDSLSVHHYIGGAKGRYGRCGKAVDYSDEAYYFTLDCLAAYQKDIDLHRGYIREHASPRYPTTICFDEWGLWHPEASHQNETRQPQTMRDALFAAGAFHTFYRNCDIVEYAMETQFSNLLQSLFETDGPRFYRTPTFHVFKLFKDHLEQLLLPISTDPATPLLDCVASASPDLGRVTITAANRHLSEGVMLRLPRALADGFAVGACDAIAPDEVRSQNTFDAPDTIRSVPWKVGPGGTLEVPRHSVVRVTLLR
jgi:alpha-L-arabinofuranosidase